MKLIYRLLLTFVIALASLATVQPSQAQTTTIKTLVLYDAPTVGDYRKLSLAYAIMLRNLLGHWNTSVDLLPVQNYSPGKIEQYGATFYLGGSYDNQLPTSLVADIDKTSKTIVWFKYNLWQYAWNSNYAFNQKYGFSFVQVRGLNSAPSNGNPAPGFFDTVNYKGEALVKYYAYDSANLVVNADPDIGQTQVLDAAKASVVVSISNPKAQQAAPYIVRSGNFWYVADLPFSYIGPRDRYLVICDALHDILGVATAPSHRALIRLEDVGALVDPATMRTLSDYLKSKSIPFSIATIPFYRDPLGAYTGGVSQEIHLAQATDLKNSLNYALQRGGKIVMHGYTHQYNSMPNKFNAVSGDDWEFWDATHNTPTSDESVEASLGAWAGARLDAGLSELRANGYSTFAWEAPHYQSSPTSIRAAVKRFKTTYQRVVYYTADKPNLATADGNRDYAVGQFFPYVINVDYYGQRVLPENLGNIEYDISAIDPNSGQVYTWQDLNQNAMKARVVRDGFASFFFHPFWLEPELQVPGFTDLQKLVDSITQLGFTWVDASGL
jgi:uncharacterized protein YdaL